MRSCARRNHTSSWGWGWDEQKIHEDGGAKLCHHEEVMIITNNRELVVRFDCTRVNTFHCAISEDNGAVWAH
jgi:hypothetical protein